MLEAVQRIVDYDEWFLRGSLPKTKVILMAAGRRGKKH